MSLIAGVGIHFLTSPFISMSIGYYELMISGLFSFVFLGELIFKTSTKKEPHQKVQISKISGVLFLISISLFFSFFAKAILN